MTWAASRAPKYTYHELPTSSALRTGSAGTCGAGEVQERWESVVKRGNGREEEEETGMERILTEM